MTTDHTNVRLVTWAFLNDVELVWEPTDEQSLNAEEKNENEPCMDLANPVWGVLAREGDEYWNVWEWLGGQEISRETAERLNWEGCWSTLYGIRRALPGTDPRSFHLY